LTAYDDMDAAELRAELQICEDSLEKLVDKMICSLEAGDWVWTSALLIAVKTQLARKKALRRRLTLEVA
jgi:hypothetical protein